MRGPRMVAVERHDVQYFVDAAVRSGVPVGPTIAAGDDYALGAQRAITTRNAMLRVHEIDVPERQRFGRQRYLLPVGPAVSGTHHVVAHSPAIIRVREHHVI